MIFPARHRRKIDDDARKLNYSRARARARGAREFDSVCDGGAVCEEVKVHFAESRGQANEEICRLWLTGAQKKGAGERDGEGRRGEKEEHSHNRRGKTLVKSRAYLTP